MKSSRFGTRVVASLALCMSLVMAGVASAASRWCFEVPGSTHKICLPFLTEEIPIKLPPNPGPYQPVDVRAFSEELMDILGTTQTKWILTDALGDRVVVMDFEAQIGHEVEQPVGP